MGRSGGGGGGHSSGGFSGGHSSGGFSGGGRSSGRSSWSSGSSWSGGSSHHNYYGGGWFWGSSYTPYRDYRTDRRTMASILSNIYIIVIVFIIIMAFAISLNNNSYNIPKSTKNRSALSGVVTKTDWYKDDIGWITSKSTLISGLEDFYKKTGIQPYVLFVPYSAKFWNGNNINSTVADEYLEEVYSKTFKDEGHFIFAYFQCKNDIKSEMDGEFRYLLGYSADSIMDSEALTIFWGFFQKNYYNTSLSMEKMISNTFSETAKSIMSKATTGWDVFKVIVIVIAIVVIIIFVYKTIKIKEKRKKEKEEYTKEILNKPLEKFGKDTSDLEEKYKDKEN